MTVLRLSAGIRRAPGGVGAGHLVATLVAGAEYGTVLLWAAVLGTVLKIGLAEGVGRWHIASGATMLGSLLGVWNGVSLLFADWVRTARKPHGRDIAIGAGCSRRRVPQRGRREEPGVPRVSGLADGAADGVAAVRRTVPAHADPWRARRRVHPVLRHLPADPAELTAGGRCGAVRLALERLLSGSSVRFLMLLVNTVKTSYF